MNSTFWADAREADDAAHPPLRKTGYATKINDDAATEKYDAIQPRSQDLRATDNPTTGSNYDAKIPQPQDLRAAGDKNIGFWQRK